MDIVKEKENWVVKIPTNQPIDEQLLVELKFSLLAQQWYEESKLFSFAKQRETPTYHAILAIGKEIIPLIIKELERGKNVWFSALKKLSGANPVQEESKGNPQKMAADWIQWAKNGKWI